MLVGKRGLMKKLVEVINLIIYILLMLLKEVMNQNSLDLTFFVLKIKLYKI